MEAASSNPLVSSAINFLRAPSERQLKDKLHFLVKSKKLSRSQTIYALQQSGLYESGTSDVILDELFSDKSDDKSDKSSIADHSSSAAQSSLQPSSSPLAPPQQPHSSAWQWIGAIAYTGIALAGSVASYLAATTSAKTLTRQSEKDLTSEIDRLRRELKEQSDLERERQHRDFMEVLNNLKSRENSVQQTMKVLKQSIALLQSQIAYQSHNASMGASATASIHHTSHNTSGIDYTGGIESAVAGGLGEDIHSNVSGGSLKSGHESLISGNHVPSNASNNRQKLGVIAGLLSEHVDESEDYSWMRETIDTPQNITDDMDSDKKAVISDSPTRDIDTSPATMDPSAHIALEQTTSKSVSPDIPQKCIYNQYWRELIDCLPIEIASIKAELKSILDEWQTIINRNEYYIENPTLKSDKKANKLSAVAVNIDQLSSIRLRSAINTIVFFLNKIISQPFQHNLRKINTFNKQYRERLSAIPKIDIFFTNIGFERTDNNVYWVLSMCATETEMQSAAKETVTDKSSAHYRQMEYLLALRDLLTNLFSETLPSQLMDKIVIPPPPTSSTDDDPTADDDDDTTQQSIVESPPDEADKPDNTSTKDTDTQQSQPPTAVESMPISTNTTDEQSQPPQQEQQSTQEPYSSKFLEVMQMVAAGKTPADVRTDIDDMPSDPTAKLSESQMEQRPKPYEIANADGSNMSAPMDETEEWLQQTKEESVTLSEAVNFSEALNDNKMGVDDDMKTESEVVMVSTSDSESRSPESKAMSAMTNRGKKGTNDTIDTTVHSSSAIDTA